MMQIDEKFLLFCSVSVVLISLYFVWPLLFLYIALILLIYYDFSPQSDNFQGHGVNKVKKLVSKVRQLAAHTFSWPNTQLRTEYDYTTPNMYTQSSWDCKRHNTSGLFTPSPKTSTRPIPSTSTPVNSPVWRGSEFAYNITPAKPARFRRPARYSLSDMSYQSPQNESTRQSSPKLIQNAAGPLLASSRYNIGMGLYADTKSPGLASRIVQYSGNYSGNSSDSNNSRRDKITHLPKYSSPGQFPVVNLNKTPLPVMKQRPVTVRIAPPDNTPYSAIDRSILLNDSLQCSQRNGNRVTPTQTEISTRSVLDALKEISRKRIHARDDHLMETNKRQRKDSVSTHSSDNEIPFSSKRNREQEAKRNETLNTSTGSSPSPKKQKYKCNDLISSLSSSIHLRKQYTTKRKADMAAHSPDANKQIKLGTDNPVYKPPDDVQSEIISPPSIVVQREPTPEIELIGDAKSNVEENDTVTMQEDDEIDSNNKKTKEGSIINENGVCRLTFISDPPEKETDVFVPFKPPTDNSKRKRLAALLGALSGENGDVKTLTEKFFPREKKDEDITDNAQAKSLIGILSPTGGKLDSVKKHVTFNLPENSVPTTPNGIINDNSTETKKNLFGSTTSFEGNNKIVPSNSTASSPIPLNFSPPASTVSSTPSTIQFGTPTAKISSETTPKSQEVATNMYSPTPTPPPYSFGGTTSSASLSNQTITTSKGLSIPQAGSSFSPTSSFNSPPQSASMFNFGVGNPLCSTSPSVPSVCSSGTSISTPSLSFSITQSQTNTTQAQTITTQAQGSAFAPLPPTQPLNNSPKTGGFKFDIIKADTVTSTPAPTFGNVPTSTPGSLVLPTTKAEPAFAFGASTKPAFETPPKTASFAAPFGTAAFGQKTPTQPTTTAGDTNVLSTSFNASNTAANGGGFAFGKTAEAKPITFGNPVATPGSFGATNSSFGTPSTTNNGFGNSPAPTFGTPATQSNVFGQTATPATGFGQATSGTTPSTGFGQNTTGAASSTSFGQSTPGAASLTGFGQVTSGVTPSTGFGQITSGATPSTGFGQITSGFGQATPSAPLFGQTSATTAPAFGQMSSTSTVTFGASTTTTTPAFGQAVVSSIPAFGQTSTSGTTGFGQTPTTSVGMFGQTSTASTGVFGQTPTTAAGMFGQTPTATNSAFGTPSGSGAIGFSTTTTAATFGTGSTAFTTSVTPFGGTPGEKPSGFGAASFGNFGTTQPAASGFGAPSGAGFSGTNSGFSAPAQTNVFGAIGTDKPAFGTGNSFASPSTSSNIFATPTTTAAKSNLPAFGNPAPGSGFGTSAFDSGSKPGAPAFSGFGATPTTQVSNQPSGSTAGVFSFGNQTNGPAPAAGASNAFQFSGANKPVTGGFNFSAGAAPSFGAVSPPAFGATTTPAFAAAPGVQFGAPAPQGSNMFSIGTGSTAPRLRATGRSRKK